VAVAKLLRCELRTMGPTELRKLLHATGSTAVGEATEPGFCVRDPGETHSFDMFPL
jgi:hypothetical protein